MNGQYSS
jgi:hypothetical protein